MIEHHTMENSTDKSFPVIDIDDVCISEIGPWESFLLIMYSVVLIVAIFGNGVVCYLIINDHRMRSVTNLFLLNLAFSDIIKALMLPITIMANLIFHYWPFGSFTCPLGTYIQVVAVFSSALTMLAMSIDRYIAILHPLRPKITNKGVVLVLICVWIMSAAVPLPTAITSKIVYSNDTDQCPKGQCIEVFTGGMNRSVYSLVILLLQYFIPLMALACTYSRIGYIIWIKKTPGEAVPMRDERLANSKRKMVKMMIIVVLVYGMCWLPIHIVTLVGDYDPRLYEQEYTKLIWNTSFWLAMSHACYNPFVYVWMNKTFRRGFYKIFATCCCKKARRTNSLQEEHTMTMTLSTRNGHSGSQSGSNSV
ncbi:neuropeptide Y receptor [Mytilus galloprovincialis]|uniref:Neuropeptide Y receptor n=1 Tax=Mytilus galloprovincialis TaxID=29158 RepID=A0A8B6CNT2_MYTGA|nr:neuropeptide Y receptor [Mytilus galloprovincialis]